MVWYYWRWNKNSIYRIIWLYIHIMSVVTYWFNHCPHFLHWLLLIHLFRCEIETAWHQQTSQGLNDWWSGSRVSALCASFSLSFSNPCLYITVSIGEFFVICIVNLNIQRDGLHFIHWQSMINEKKLISRFARLWSLYHFCHFFSF